MATTVDGEVMLQLLQEFRDFRLEMRSSFQGLDGRVSGLDARMNALEGEMQVLNGRMSTLETLFESLDRRVGLLDQRVGSLEALFGSLDRRVGSLETLFGSLDRRVGSLEVMVTHLHVTSQRILGYIKRVGKMLIQVATDRDELDARVDNHERRLIFLEK